MGPSRGILRTYTGGDDYKTNGRAGAEVNMLKKATRTLPKSSGVANTMCSLAARHGAERRFRDQLGSSGLPMKTLLLFGATGYAKQRIWEEKYQDWKLTRKKVMIYKPDINGFNVGVNDRLLRPGRHWEVLPCCGRHPARNTARRTFTSRSQPG